MYELVAKIAEQTRIVQISRKKVLSIINIFEITDDISGNESPKPTPAPQIIAPINKTSNTNFKIQFLISKIPEKVKLDSGFRVNARPNATTGRQYIAHAVKPQ